MVSGKCCLYGNNTVRFMLHRHFMLSIHSLILSSIYESFHTNAFNSDICRKFIPRASIFFGCRRDCSVTICLSESMVVLFNSDSNRFFDRFILFVC